MILDWRSKQPGKDFTLVWQPDGQATIFGTGESPTEDAVVLIGVDRFANEFRAGESRLRVEKVWRIEEEWFARLAEEQWFARLDARLARTMGRLSEFVNHYRPHTQSSTCQTLTAPP